MLGPHAEVLDFPFERFSVPLVSGGYLIAKGNDPGCLSGIEVFLEAPDGRLFHLASVREEFADYDDPTPDKAVFKLESSSPDRGVSAAITLTASEIPEHRAEPNAYSQIDIPF